MNLQTHKAELSNWQNYGQVPGYKYWELEFHRITWLRFANLFNMTDV